jgi:quercetin dioxygenase-like cupin family protein
MGTGRWPDLGTKLTARTGVNGFLRISTMAIYIDTSQCERRRLPDSQGTLAEVMNRSLCRAENGTAMLRWLEEGDRFQAEARESTHQLIYLIEGAGIIELEGKDYEVAQGGGIYLGSGEAAGVRPGGHHTLKLFHLVVPESEN